MQTIQQRPDSSHEQTPFRSVLFDGADTGAGVDEEAPPFFADLNLDQVITSITAGREEYHLEPFFYAPLHSVGAVDYRHEVLRDLEDERLYGHIASFAEEMRTMRNHLAQIEKLRHRYQKEAWFLDAVDVYCHAVKRLAHDLTLANVSSRGFRGLREYLTSYVRSYGFTSLLAETKKLKDDLASVRYCLHIRDSRVTVTRYESEADYSADVLATFEKFKQGAVKDYRVDFSSSPDMNHVEAQVLDRVALLYPEVFSALDSYCGRHRDYLDATLRAFDREVQFYVAYLDYVAGFEAAGLAFCYPCVSDRSKEVQAYQTFDLALANRLIPEHSSVVCNDLSLKESERILVVTGPNQGGKTTFARTFGQLHYLASLGCRVPGREARLFLFDQLFTHFEKEEDLANLRSKLEDDLLRIHDILERATANSILIMNESFTSTTLSDALFLGREVLQRIVRLDSLCVCVTFVDELASLSETTVSMVSTVVPEDPASRTYRIVRKPADGLAYAAAIAQKYGLTYDRLRERITS